MQTVSIISVGYELVGYLLCLATGTTEYYAVYIGVVIRYTLKGQIFVLCLNHIVYMAHVFRALVAVAGHKLHRVVHETTGDTGYLFGHSGREHEHLAVLGHM